MCRRMCSLVPAMLMGALLLCQTATANDPSLVGWWTFEEGSGIVAADSSGNSNDGTLAPAEALWDDSDPQVGDYALALSGTHKMEGVGYVEVPHSDTLNLGAGDFTIALWGKREEGSDRDDLITKKDDIADMSLFIIDDVLRFYAKAGEVLTVDSADTIPTGQWVHMAVVRENGVVRFYIDAKESGGGDNPTNFDNAGIMRIGSNRRPADNFTMNPFEGFLDDVRIYNRALSAEEIGSLVPGKGKARQPDPADGDLTVVTPLLKWIPGNTAILHDVYVGTDPNLGPDDLAQSHAPVALHFYTSELIPGTTYYWRVDEIEADMTTVHTGDIWTFVARPVVAYLPDPADGANEASSDPNMTLAWLAGRGAAQHRLYFGGNLADVKDAAAGADQGTLQDATFAPGSLEPLATYFWRVDELAKDGTVQPGGVWTFSTFASVEDFEPYTDEEGSRIYETWADGWVNDTGSQAGYVEAPFAEQMVVNSGNQSMPLDYDNVVSPYYSETSRTWDAPQDWTAGGAETLVLYVSGNLRNAPEALYVAVEGSASRVAVAVHPDPMAVGNPKWQRWAIPLSEFSAAGVNLQAVETVHIGLGDRDAPKAGGAGLIFVDDIRLAKPAAGDAGQ